MRESQLRNKIKEILKEELNVKSKNRLNESVSISDMNKAMEILEAVFEDGDTGSFGEVISAAISNVIGRAKNIKEVNHYADLLSEFMWNFENISLDDIKSQVEDMREELADIN